MRRAGLLGWRPMPAEREAPGPDSGATESRKTGPAARHRPSDSSATAPPPREPQPVSVRVLVSAALIVLGLVALVAFLTHLIGIVLLVLLAIVFAEGIRPIVQRL